MTGTRMRELGRPWHPEPAGEAAAAWILLQDRGELSEADERRFADWLAENPDHVAAYENAIWALEAVARHAGEPEMLALRSSALSARGTRRQLWGWTGAIGTAAAAAAAAAFLWIAPHPQVSPFRGAAGSVAERPSNGAEATYQTGIGERSAINLPDGSVVTLDTDSQMRVAFSGSERAVQLLKGQALFQVAHGRPTPFRVYASGQRITAVGTTFNVRIAGKSVRVSMIEGVVKVRPIPVPEEAPDAPVKEVSLSGGEAVVASAQAPFVVTPVEPRDVAAWRGGRIILNDVSLADAVEEINRYTTKPIAIGDDSSRRLRVSGVFKSSDPERFSQAMAEILPVEVSHASNGSVVITAETR